MKKRMKIPPRGVTQTLLLQLKIVYRHHHQLTLLVQRKKHNLGARRFTVLFALIRH